ncbi:MAG: antitoxin FitA [Thermoanaerobaculia bacterium]|jgi:plasmid stability protein|nr:antitoxin FitA [Thermoanaerobaculia bacterium]
MTELLVDEIEDDVFEKLRERAHSHGRSTKEEAREILRNALRTEEKTRPGLGTRIADRFRGIGLEQEIPELRGYPAQPADFDDQ